MSRKEIKFTEAEIEAKVEELDLWIKEQPNMPQNLGKSETFRILLCLFWPFRSSSCEM